MASKFQAPRGTFDVLPEQAHARARVEGTAVAILARAGYEPIATPTFEDTDLFERGVGRSTDIVRKEMFTFEDKGERSLRLLLRHRKPEALKGELLAPQRRAEMLVRDVRLEA